MEAPDCIRYPILHRRYNRPGITERCQLGAVDAAALHAVQEEEATFAAGAALSPDTGGGKQTEADRVAAAASLAASRQLPGTWHFPVSHVREVPRKLLSRVRVENLYCERP